MSWPIGIIIFYAVFLVAILGFLIFSQFNSIDLVSKDYYQKEITYQKQIDRIENTNALSRSIILEFNETSRTITLKIPPEIQDRGITGKVLFFRPSDAKQDNIMELNIDHAGHQLIDVSHLSKGFWRVKLFWQVDAEEYYDEKSLVIK